MLKILQLLRASRSVKTFKVLDFKQGRDFYYLRLEAVLTTGEVLYIREYVSTSGRMYSYHWQDRRGTLICRWDNAPHYKELKTFPYHKHTPKGVEESLETDLEDVLREIEKTLGPELRAKD